MRKLTNIALMILSLVLISGLLVAIGDESDKSGEKKQSEEKTVIDLSKKDIPKLVEIIRIWKLVDELELKEDQLVEFLPRFKELEHVQGEYYRNNREHLSKLKTLLDSESSDQKMKAAIDEFRKSGMEIRQKEQELKDKLYSGLSPKQQAKFIVFQDVYRRDMKRLIGNLQKLSKLKNQRYQPESIQQKR